MSTEEGGYLRMRSHLYSTVAYLGMALVSGLIITGIVILINASLSFSILLIGIFLCLITAFMLPPTKIYLLWMLILIVYVLWPFKVVEIDKRIGLNIPLEYVPLLMVLVAGLLSGLLRGRHLIPNRPKFLVISASGIILYNLISILWVKSYIVWFEYFSMWVVYLVLFFTMINNLSEEPAQHMIKFLDIFFLFLTTYILCVIIRHFVSASQQYSWSPHLDFTPFIRYRISETMTILPFISVSISMYFTTMRLRYLIFGVTSSFAIVSSFSRISIIGLVVILLLISLTTRRHRTFNGKRTAIAMPIYGVIAVGIIGAICLSGEQLIKRLRSMLIIREIWFGNPSISEIGGARYVLIQEALRIFWERPWWGTGVGNYWSYFSKDIPIIPAKPHNLYLSYLAEFGIVGFSFLIGFLICLTYFFLRSVKRISDPKLRLIAKGFTIGHISLMVMFLAQEFITTPYVWFFWGLGVAFVKVAQRKQKKVTVAIQS